MSGERGEVAIGRTTGDFGSPAEYVVRRRRIALDDALDRERNQEIALHDAFETCLVEQTFCSNEPARRGSKGATLEAPECQPERGPGGALPVTSLEELVMRATPDRLALDVFSNQVGRRRQPLEILRVKRRFAVDRFQQSKRVGPRPSRERLPAGGACLVFPHGRTILDRGRQACSHSAATKTRRHERNCTLAVECETA